MYRGVVGGLLVSLLAGPALRAEQLPLKLFTAADGLVGDFIPQETRLLALTAEGASYQAAGEQLFISINTVRRHIRSIYEKLQVHTKSEAVSKAMRAGLI